MFCHCGCGARTSIAKHTVTEYGHVAGQPVRYVPGHNQRRSTLKGKYQQVRHVGHPHAAENGILYAHVAIASRALGKPLPPKAEVHHVDGNSHNNANTNLVICQDHTYHALLEYRTKILKLGGDPNTQKWCSDCSQMKPLGDFNVSKANKSSGRQAICRLCSRKRFAARGQAVFA